ncbi:MAG: PASTA domain-containing protein [Bacteroidales bacterium]|jgi:beta-lactam-binding protein with PASTA domain|nr:PASTA domain-containing protein [Bacteroidales bacterium]
MSLRNFIFSRLFAKHLGIAAAVTVGGIIVILIWLSLYTRHGQARPVPDFVGLSTEETQKLASEHRLKYQITDSIYTNMVPKGSIAEQSPKPGFKVKKWRNVALVINAFNPEMTAMPNLIDLPKRQAIMMIESSGLAMGELKYKPDLSVDIVLEQQVNGRNISEGDSIQKGTVIDLVLGKGLSNQSTPVPYLIGNSLADARNIILEASLNLGAYIFDNDKDSAGAFVYRQNPEYSPEAGLQLGSTVYVWLTTDSAKLPADSLRYMVNDTLPMPQAITQPPADI